MWWRFHPNSTLAKYIHELGYSLKDNFRPIELINIIENIAESHQLYDKQNSDYIIPNKQLYRCLLSMRVSKKKLYKYCLPHVFVTEENQLHFSLLYPSKLIYKDPSSLFWVNPSIGSAINPTALLTYTWQSLCSAFISFVSHPDNHLASVNMKKFYLKPDTILTKELKCSVIDTDNIQPILSKFVKFLGKTNTLFTLCEDLTFKDAFQLHKLSTFIENIIVFNTDVVPSYLPDFHL